MAVTSAARASWPAAGPRIWLRQLSEPLRCHRCDASLRPARAASALQTRALTTTRPSRADGRSDSGYGGEDETRFRFRKDHLRPIIRPLILLSIVTSLAFNCATLRRTVREEEAAHAVRIKLLQEIIESARHPQALPSGTAPDAAAAHREEVRRAVRLMKASLSPRDLGVDPSVCDGAEAQLLRQGGGPGGREVRWSEALFGKPGQVKSSMLKAVDRAASVFEGWRTGTGSPEAADAAGGSHHGDEWTEKDWEAALERALQGSVTTAEVASQPETEDMSALAGLILQPAASNQLRHVAQRAPAPQPPAAASDSPAQTRAQLRTADASPASPARPAGPTEEASSASVTPVQGQRRRFYV